MLTVALDIFLGSIFVLFCVNNISVQYSMYSEYTCSLTNPNVCADFAVCDGLCYWKALCDIKFSQIDGNSPKSIVTQS